MADRVEAQRRADQIRAFQAELEALRIARVLPLTRGQHDSIRAYHNSACASGKAGIPVIRAIRRVG